MTPIKMIVQRGVAIHTRDFSDQEELQCLAESEQKADWLAWSLAHAHKVTYSKESD